MSRKVIVLLTGTAASIIGLAWAKAQAEEVHAVTFVAGEEKTPENTAVVQRAVRAASAAVVSSHEVIFLANVKGSDRPGEGMLQLAYLANRAAALQAHGIVIGDCPELFSRAVVDAGNLAIQACVYGEGTINHPIYTPLFGIGPETLKGFTETASPLLEAADKTEPATAPVKERRDRKAKDEVPPTEA